MREGVAMREFHGYDTGLRSSKVSKSSPSKKERKGHLGKQNARCKAMEAQERSQALAGTRGYSSIL